MAVKKVASSSPAAFSWDAKTPATIATALKTLSAFYPALKGGKNAAKLVFRQGKDKMKCSVKEDKNTYTITYGKPNMALRMVGNLLAGIVPKKEEYCPFEMFGIMLDCSRNAVMKTEYMKKYFARLALFGYNMVMLYTEDTYAIKSEPVFGFMRGALSEKEIRDMDKYCAALGMEMIPCIQTLGHLETLLRWGNFGEVADTPGILLAEEPKTYELIEKMLLTWKNNVRTRRIHVGMDETHNIGRGRYYDLHGDVRHVDIFNRHLAKVVELCKKHGLDPMIWSDMYFRLGSKNNDYYDKDSVIGPDVVKMIPKGVELVYWDYYHDNKDFYNEWIKRHRAIAGEPLVGSGVWTWNMFWYGKNITEQTVIPCVEACRESKVKELFFTMWGDDGGFCDYDSAMAGLGFASELSFTGEVCNGTLNQKFDALLEGANYDDILTAAGIEPYAAPSLFWDDPIMLLFLGPAKARKDFIPGAIKNLKTVCSKLAKVPKRGAAGDLKHAKNIADAMLAKLILGDTMLDAYFSKNPKKALKAVLPLVDDYETKFKTFVASFRAMWMAHNKVFGYETMQIRFAGQLARVEELKLRLKEFIAGKVPNIPEFDELKKVKGNCWVWGYKGISHATTII